MEELTREKTFDKISVKDISEKCGFEIVIAESVNCLYEKAILLKK